MTDHHHDDAAAASAVQVAERRLVRSQPFHAALVASWRKQVDHDIPTAAVTIRDGHVVLLYAPAFVLSCTLDELVAVLEHEANHVIFGHLMLTPDEHPDGAALLVATEVTANEWVRGPLPGVPVVLADHPELPADEDAVQRYHRLARAGETRTVTPLDDHAPWAEARAAGVVGKAVIRESLRQAREVTATGAWDALPAAVRRRVDGELRGHGDAPHDAVTALDGGAAARVDWRVALRSHVGSILGARPSFRRPPRRLPELVGVVAGRAWQRAYARVLAAIDTSGSMSQAELELVAGELSRLGRTHEVTIAECDARIHAVYRFRGRLRSVSGGGGTDLRPPLAPCFLARHRPDLVVYFTDGCGPAPAASPAVPVIWCLVGAARRPAPWGRVIAVAK